MLRKEDEGGRSGGGGLACARLDWQTDTRVHNEPEGNLQGARNIVESLHASARSIGASREGGSIPTV